MSDIVKQMCADLIVPEQLIEDALWRAHIRVRRIKVPKRAGGHRIVFQPAAELKMIQGWLLTQVLSKLPVSHTATAFETGMSIVKNAMAHKQSLYSVKVDLKDFFPSIKSTDILRILSNTSALPEWAKAEDCRTLITKACFDRNKQLPIGYMTSPRIANAVMFEFDHRLTASISADVDRFGDAILTRYADDLYSPRIGVAPVVSSLILLGKLFRQQLAQNSA